jgi:hypothetical protein
MKKEGLIGAIVIAGIGVLIGWVMWGPLLHWILAQFPKDASWYGFVKVGGILLVGGFGGVAVPLILLLFAVKWFADWA